MWQTYIRPDSLAEALDLLRTYGKEARIVAGGTDVLIELQRGVKPTSTLIDITALNDLIRSQACRQYALPLVQACWEVGAPQIRTRATVVGNVVTASPANDTITPLMALGADVVLLSCEGERIVPLHTFYAGVRRTVCRPDELVREICLPVLAADQRGLFLKLGLRLAQAISVINVAFLLTFTEDDIVSEAKITLGSLAPTIVHASAAEAYLMGKQLSDAVCQEAGKLACADIRPIDDVRATASYRLATLASLVTHGLQRLAAKEQPAQSMEQPVTLETPGKEPTNQRDIDARSAFTGTIETTINGQPYQLV